MEMTKGKTLTHSDHQRYSIQISLSSVSRVTPKKRLSRGRNGDEVCDSSLFSFFSQLIFILFYHANALMLFVIICLVCPVLSVMSSWKAVSPASFVSSSSLHAFNCFTLSLLIQEVSRLFPFAPCFPFFVGEDYFLLVFSSLVTR